MMHGGGMYSGESWESGLYHVKDTLARSLSEGSFDENDNEALEGVDLDG